MRDQIGEDEQDHAAYAYGRAMRQRFLAGPAGPEELSPEQWEYENGWALAAQADLEGACGLLARLGAGWASRVILVLRDGEGEWFGAVECMPGLVLLRRGGNPTPQVVFRNRPDAAIPRGAPLFGMVDRPVTTSLGAPDTITVAGWGGL